jgi:hypothetical protein
MRCWRISNGATAPTKRSCAASLPAPGNAGWRRSHRSRTSRFYLDLSGLLRPNLSPPAATADDVVNRLLAEAGVACVSGAAFGDPAGLRLSYGIPAEQLETGLWRLVAVLNAWE